MKKAFFQIFVTVDDCMQDPNCEIDRHLLADEFNAYAVEMLNASDVLVMGRRTYELMAGYWPTALGDDTDVKEKI